MVVYANKYVGEGLYICVVGRKGQKIHEWILAFGSHGTCVYTRLSFYLFLLFLREGPPTLHYKDVESRGVQYQ